MEKKDLVIGKKYLQSESFEVYYLGETDYGSSITQDANGNGGIELP